MGEVASPTIRKIFLLMFIISILALSSSQMLSSPNHGTLPQDDNSKQPENTGLDQQFASDPFASPRPVNESAMGRVNNQFINLTQSVKDITTTLRPGWSTSSITTTVYNLWDRRDWVSNGNLTSSSDRWTFYSVNAPSHTNTFSSGWAGSGVGGSPGYIYGRINGDPSVYYDAGDRMSWNQTVTVPRGTVISARIEFSYYVSAGASNLDAEVYAWVGNARVNGIAYVNMPLPLASWHSVSWDVSVSSITMPNILVSVGHRHLVTMSYGGIGTYAQVYFDSVKLIIKAYAKPDQIQLKMQRGSAIAAVSNLDWGKGSVTLTGFTIGPPTTQTSYPFTFTSNVSLPSRSEFTANATIGPTSLTSATASFENEGSKVAWSLSFATEFDQDNYAAGNTYYTKYYFNVSVPSDWTYTTCIDPDSKTHTIASEANNFTVTVVGLKKILTVNVTRIASYSTYGNSYAPYSVHAESLNYVKEMWTQKLSGSVWINETNFYPQQTMKVVAYIAGASPVSTGIANLTIRGPPAYNTTPVIIETMTGVTPVNGFANFTKLLPNSYAAGNYSAQVDWVDNALGEAGSSSSEFNVTHKFQMAIAIPGAGDVIVKGKTLLNPPTSVSVLDYYTGQFVTATVKARASWESAGRWDTFTTYSVVNATYTNITYVPSSLIPGTQSSMTANASKPFYDNASVTNIFWIGSEAIVGTQSNINVYFAESQTFYVRLDDIAYNEKDTGNPITNATIALSAAISSNNTLVQWNVRFTADYSKKGTGKYSGTIYTGTFSASVKGIPPGTYTVWFKLNQGQWYETKFFSLQLTIFPAPSYLTAVSGSGQYVFWGSIAQIKLSYNTTWTYGGYSLPQTAILNSTSSPSYAPPYVSVICGWGGAWTATHVVLDPDGVYTLFVNTTSFTTPTNDGEGAGVTSFNVRLNKTGYSLSNAVPITLHIKRLTTAMTGAVLLGGGVVSATNDTSTYPGDYKSILVWYNDTHTGAPLGISGATLTYTSSGGNALGSGSLAPVAGQAGLYNLSLSGSVTDKLPGTYYLYMTGSKGNYYVLRTITVTLSILPITSTLEAQDPPATAFYGQRLVFLIWFNDTHNNLPISGATLQVSTVPAMSMISPYEVPGIPGLYNLTIPGGQSTGSYSITISSNKTKYADGIEVLSLQINRLPTSLTPYIIAGDGSHLYNLNATVAIGTDLTIYVWFNDTYNLVPIPGLGTSITYDSTKFGSGWLQAVSGTPGLYSLNVHCSDAGSWGITFTVNAPGYETHTVEYIVVVEAPGGFSVVQLAMMGLGGGGVVLVVMLAYVFIRRARVPFIIKKIDESLKLIGKGDHESATPVALRSREELVVGITQERIDVFGKRPAGREAGEGAAEVGAAAPTAETTALKKELEAVEPKEKSGEVIEEVEMDTLDEELQKLERFEEKENLPDGAKEVRDVVEKYKQSKKKKE